MFGDKIKHLREEKRITRKELSIALNITYSSLSKYETNVRFPDKDTLKVISEYFNVSIDYLLGKSDKRQNDEISTVEIVKANHFIQVPEELIYNAKYKNLSSDAKLIYGILLMHMDSNGYINNTPENGSVTRSYIKNSIGISQNKCVKSFKQLIEFGLIEETKRGLCKPNLILIKFPQCRKER